MKLTPRARTKTDLADSTHQRLNMYALAAGAAGVSLLSFAQPSEAEIIYTSAHITLGPTTYLDLNHDGINDFKFANVHSSHCEGVCTTTFAAHRGTAFNSQNGNLAVYGVAGSNHISGTGGFAAALRLGARVGPGGKFAPGGTKMMHANAQNSSNAFGTGPWAGTAGLGTYRCLGFKFVISGQVHFGWARIQTTVTRNASIQATLTGYAYETVPGRPIIAGAKTGPVEAQGKVPAATSAPASLGLLALGAPGLSIWRRDEELAPSSAKAN